MPQPARSISGQSNDARLGSDLVALMPAMKTYAWKICHSPERAEELTHNALLKAWAARSSFRPGTNLKAWIFVILRNEIFSYYRRAARESRWCMQCDEYTMQSVPEPETHVWSGLKFRDAVRGLDSINPEQREAIVALYLREMNYEQIAALQNCPVGTVKSRVNRGLKRLHAWNDDGASGERTSAQPISALR
jgi:RNA polymerase sigma-70 factor, ECF subfamily